MSYNQPLKRALFIFNVGRSLQDGGELYLIISYKVHVYLKVPQMQNKLFVLCQNALNIFYSEMCIVL